MFNFYILEAKIADQQLKNQIAVVQSVEQQLSLLRKENMTLADQLLDKDAELSTLKSKVEAIHVEQEHQTKLEHMQAQLETEYKKRQSLEIESKVQLNQLEKECCTLMSESQQYQQQFQTVKEELELTHQSFNEYKLRAQRILQVLSITKIILNSDFSQKRFMFATGQGQIIARYQRT